MKNQPENHPGHPKGVGKPQGGSTSDRAFKDTTQELKKHGVSNSGGQLSNQTDNKQSNVNRGNQSPDVQGKKHAPRQ